MLRKIVAVCVWGLLSTLSTHIIDLSQEPPLTIREVPLNLITTLSDAKCVASTLYGESRGEPLEGSRAVLDVIQERMLSRDMTACQVVSEPGQFAGYNSKRLITINMLTALATVVKMSPVAPEAQYFHTIGTRVNWKHTKLLTTVGKHGFYVTTGEAR